MAGRQTVPRSELTGTTNAMSLLNRYLAQWFPDLHGADFLAAARAVTDASYVSRQWSSPPLGATNHDLWLQATAMKRRLDALGIMVDLEKIKAHQDKDGWKNLEQDQRTLRANAAADAIADWSAEKLQVPFSVASDLRNQDELASRIIARLAVIELECVKLYKATGKPPVLPPPPKVAPFDVWTKRVAESGHQLVWTGRRLLCKICQMHNGLATAPKWICAGRCPGFPQHRRASFLKEQGLRRCYAPQTARWLDLIGQVISHLETNPPEPVSEDSEGEARVREGPTLATVHRSHVMRVRGAWTWCARCGAYSSGLRWFKLTKPCGRPNHLGLCALARVRRNLPPGKQKGQFCLWGDEHRAAQPAAACAEDALDAEPPDCGVHVVRWQ